MQEVVVPNSGTGPRGRHSSNRIDASPSPANGSRIMPEAGGRGCRRGGSTEFVVGGYLVGTEPGAELIAAGTRVTLYAVPLDRFQRPPEPDAEGAGSL